MWLHAMTCPVCHGLSSAMACLGDLDLLRTESVGELPYRREPCTNDDADEEARRRGGEEEARSQSPASAYLRIRTIEWRVIRATDLPAGRYCI